MSDTTPNQHVQAVIDDRQEAERVIDEIVALLRQRGYDVTREAVRQAVLQKAHSYPEASLAAVARDILARLLDGSLTVDDFLGFPPSKICLLYTSDAADE